MKVISLAMEIGKLKGGKEGFGATPKAMALVALGGAPPCQELKKNFEDKGKNSNFAECPS
jgi:hypothetical protein